MKQTSLNRLKLKQKIDINSIAMFKACLVYNAKIQPKVKIELAKWPMYLQYWQHLEKYQHITPFTIKTTTDNLTLRGDFIKSPVKNDNNNKTMILLHGITNTRFWIFKQVVTFLKAGYNVIWYDARNHGASDEAPTTFGLKEAQDLQDIINYSCQTYPQQATSLGLYGFSLGGATVITWSELYHKYAINEKVKLIISDSTFSRLDHTYNYTISNYMFLPTKFMLNFVNKKAKKTIGIPDLKPLQPIKYLKLIPTMPILFLHGTKDNFIIPRNGNDLFYEKIRYETTKKSAFYTIHDAYHGQNFLLGDLEHAVINEHNATIKDSLTTVVINFLQKWLITPEIA